MHLKIFRKPKVYCDPILPPDDQAKAANRILHRAAEQQRLTHKQHRAPRRWAK